MPDEPLSTAPCSKRDRIVPLRRFGRALVAFFQDRRGAEGAEKLLLMGALILPLLGVLLFFKGEIAEWAHDSLQVVLNTSRETPR